MSNRDGNQSIVIDNCGSGRPPSVNLKGGQVVLPNEGGFIDVEYPCKRFRGGVPVRISKENGQLSAQCMNSSCGLRERR